MMNRQIVLAARPTGAAGVEHFRLQEVPVPAVGDGEVLVKTSFFSVDPYMRMRLNDVKSYAPPQKLNEVMGGGSAGIVVESRFPGLVAGDAVVMGGGWQEYALLPGKTLRKVDAKALPLEAYLGPAGMTGVTAWHGLFNIIAPKAGETVLVNGATGAAGSLAVQIAKLVGAKKVIATGRDPEALRKLAGMGADTTISLSLEKEALEKAFAQEFAQGVDVVLDYLWGPSALVILIAAARAGKEAVPIRYVHIGAASAATIELPGAVLRSSSLVLMGSGIGSIPLERLIAVTGEVMQAAIPARLHVETEVLPLAEVEQGWTQESSKRRLVFATGGLG